GVNLVKNELGISGVSGGPENTDTTVSGTCTSLPSNAVYFNNTTNYSLVSAPSGTSLSAVTAGYSASPVTNTCQFKCGGGFSWNGGSCTNAIGPYMVSGANNAYYMIPCNNCNLSDVSLSTRDTWCQNLGYLRTIRTNSPSAGAEYNATRYESISHNQLSSVANDFISRINSWNTGGIYNGWKSWHQGISTWGNSWNGTTDYGCTIGTNSCSSLGYSAGINGANTFVPCAAP
ncbi:MAG: hypothetical protein PHU93_02255, partial [Candidatus Gracilibacteria bacterium]|nr:hypothetical protein [Candidatus Gracilibacteria bacterium]